MHILLSTWTVLKDFTKKKCLTKNVFIDRQKGTTGDNGQKLDGHINDGEYLTCKKIWDKFDMKNMGDYHDHSLKLDVL